MVGATRAGLADAKEGVGKQPERYKLVEPGTIFYNPMRILLGSIAFLDEGVVPGITSPDYVVFKTKPGFLHPRWFYYWLRSDAGASFIKTLARGAVRERMLFRRLAAAEIDVPPYDVQCAFARCIPAAERAWAAAEAQLMVANALRAAYVRTLFDSEDMRRWPSGQIGQVAKVQSGYAFKSEWFAAEGIRLLRNANVFQGYVAWDEEVRLPSERRSAFTLYELSAGDIVLSLDRPVVSSGLKVARLEDSDVPALLLQRVGRFRIHGLLEPDYLYAFLNSTAFLSRITGHDQSLGVPHVSPSQVEAVELPLPPPSEQKRMADVLGRHTIKADCVCEAVENELAAINALPAALLRRAFSGAL